MAKYDPLRDFLQVRPDRVTLSFDEVASLVGGLPESADRHAAWWANDETHVQAVAWMAAGYVVEQLDQLTRHVTLARVKKRSPGKRTRPLAGDA